MITVITGGSGSGKSAYAEKNSYGFWRPGKDLHCHHVSFDEEATKRLPATARCGQKSSLP